MRRGMDPKFVYVNDSKELLGVTLSSDHCSEHEWGINDIKHDFGINSQEIGLLKRKISTIPCSNLEWGKSLIFYKDNSRPKKSYLVYTHNSVITTKKFYNLDLIKYYSGENKGKYHEIGAAWDEQSFGVVSTSHDALKELHDAFLSLDICIGLFNGHIFHNAGLGIIIASKIPQEMIADWTKSDQDVIALEEEDKKTGIKDILLKAGKKWFALSPKWVSEFVNKTKEKTKYPIIYWLNPMEQDKNDFGWFTVEDLLLWANNKGPVIKNKGIKNE